MDNMNYYIAGKRKPFLVNLLIRNHNPNYLKFLEVKPIHGETKIVGPKEALPYSTTKAILKSVNTRGENLAYAKYYYRLQHNLFKSVETDPIVEIIINVNDESFFVSPKFVLQTNNPIDPYTVYKMVYEKLDMGDILNVHLNITRR